MYCINCGSELNANAKFCSYCGAKMHSEQKQPEAEIEPAAEVPPRVNDESAPEQSNAESLPTTSNAPMGSEAVGENTNLKAAVQQNKKRSRRHVPIIVLVALTLALASSVAYAAYCVYTYVYLPSQQQAEAPVVSEEVAEEESVEETPVAKPEAESHSISVSTLADSTGERSDRTWRYDLLTNPNNSTAISAINSAIESSINPHASQMESATIYDAVEVTYARTLMLSYLSDDYVSFIDFRLSGIPGTHSQSGTWSDYYGIVFDLKTGEAVDAGTALGLSNNDANSAAQSALTTFLSNSSLSSSTKSDILASFSTDRIDTAKDSTVIPGSSRLALTNKGLVYTPTLIGNEKTKYGPIVVKDFEDGSLVGTEIDDSLLYIWTPNGAETKESATQ